MRATTCKVASVRAKLVLNYAPNLFHNSSCAGMIAVCSLFVYIFLSLFLSLSVKSEENEHGDDEVPTCNILAYCSTRC